jgi:guanosine-3',5'-bis(diphosphate) 3'-pyrophosphohydrolase
MIEKMKELAFKMHNQPSASQRYGNAPYSIHLEAVVEVMKRFIYYISEDKREIVYAAGYGHDLIEDTEISESYLINNFGYEVADIIYRVSNERGRDRKERNFKTYPKIWRNDLAIFVKLCDRIANTTNSKNSGHSMYKKYQLEYPIFRYALKVRDLYPDMWKELDELNK